MYFLSYQSTATLSIYKPPWLNDRTRFWSYTDTTDRNGIGSRVVFGLSKPPDQYMFAIVPRNTEVLGLVDSTSTPSSNVPDIPPKLSSSFNLAKGMAALVQSLYASFTLYRTTGDQVNRYGFAAPGLTVLPYAVMSALNLMANLVAPHYPTLYLVRSKVMEEAERRTGLPFHYVVGKVVDEPGTKNIVMEGWSEIAGSLKDDDKLHYVSPSAEEDEKLEICDSSRQTIYVPACPRFRRTDDTQTSPLRQFIESPSGQLQFPRYQHLARRHQALIQPSFFSFSRRSLQRHLQSYVALQPQLPYSISRLPRFQTQRPASTSNPPAQRPYPLNTYEILLVSLIVGVGMLTTLVLSNFSGQQSTSAQRAWIVTWLIVGYSSGFGTYIAMSDMGKDDSDVSPMLSRFAFGLAMVACGAPAIGGFIVVSQMLKAYGICYRFV